MTPSKGKNFVSSPKNPVQYHGTASGFEKLPRQPSNHSPTRPASSISCFLPHFQLGMFSRVFLLELSPFLLSLHPVSADSTSKFGFGPAILELRLGRHDESWGLCIPWWCWGLFGILCIGPARPSMCLYVSVEPSFRVEVVLLPNVHITIYFFINQTVSIAVGFHLSLL
jgi:hypothetical protein